MSIQTLKQSKSDNTKNSAFLKHPKPQNPHSDEFVTRKLALVHSISKPVMSNICVICCHTEIHTMSSWCCSDYVYFLWWTCPRDHRTCRAFCVAPGYRTNAFARGSLGHLAVYATQVVSMWDGIGCVHETIGTHARCLLLHCAHEAPMKCTNSAKSVAWRAFGGFHPPLPNSLARPDPHLHDLLCPASCQWQASALRYSTSPCAQHGSRCFCKAFRDTINLPVSLE